MPAPITSFSVDASTVIVVPTWGGGISGERGCLRSVRGGGIIWGVVLGALGEQACGREVLASKLGRDELEEASGFG